MRTAAALALIVAAALASATPLAAQQRDAETRSEVPALTELHEVVAALWHGAWPAKDAKMMAELLPQARAGVAKVAEARLPGILRDKQAAWDEGVAALKRDLSRYEAAVASGSQQGMLDAVEAFHARYEGLVRVTRPPMKELDAFHVPLYTVYHHALPREDWPAVAAAAGEMAAACGALAAAPLPKRFADREADVRPQIAALCGRADALRAAAAGDERKATADGVEAVHAQYEKVEALLR